MSTLSGIIGRVVTLTVLVMSILALPIASFAQAPIKPKPGIVCWKDKSGKVVGCGDSVPPEYRDAATKELDKQGITRNTGESAAEAEARRAKEQATGQNKADEERRAAEKKRKDSALLNTYTDEKEIDLKRDRELKAADQSISQQQAALKLANERHADATKRGAKDEIARAERDKGVIEKGIAAKEAEKGDLTKRYAEEKKRFMDLKGIPQPAATAPATIPAPATAAAPAATPAPAAAPAKK
jgi:hypothetical protein